MCPRTMSIIAPIWPLARDTRMHCVSCEAVLSGFQRTESIQFRRACEESMRCIAIVREFENTMSFMWEWQTVMQAYEPG